MAGSPENPLVSIVIPVYNGANFMREAIDSALEQSYPNCEVLVVNDGSRDGGATREIALSYGDRIRYFEKENGGVATALNRGIEEMRGEYFSWLSHDDVYLPEKVARQVRYLSEHGLVDVVLYSDFSFIDGTGAHVGDPPDISGITPEEFRTALIKGNPIHGCTALIPARCFAKVGNFKPQLRSTQDYELWFRMAREFPFVYQNEKLIHSRLHAEQGCLTLGGAHLAECNALNINAVDEIIASGSIPGYPSRSSFALSMALGLLRKGHYQAASHAHRLSRSHLTETPLHQRPLYYLQSLVYGVSSSVHRLRRN